MGFAPKDNPRIAVAVYVENGGWGATFGVPYGALIMEQYLTGHLSEASEQKAEALIQRTISYGNPKPRN
jgi:penicillin-binding protein 2